MTLQRTSLEGQIVPCSPKVQMVGAENRGAVTCYLDSLLFAMFAKLSAFECMLKDNPEQDQAKRKLAFLLRLWVNMLRTGKLIHTDMVRPLAALRCDSVSVAKCECRLKKFKKPSPRAGGRMPSSSSNKTRPKPSLSSPRHCSSRS